MKRDCEAERPFRATLRYLPTNSGADRRQLLASPFERVRLPLSGGMLRLLLAEAGAGQRVLVRRWGLRGGTPTTLAEISEEMGVSRERVRQFQREAERRLRREFVGEGGFGGETKR